jgi:hypothetical protein
MTVGDFTEGVGISQGYTVLDLLAAAQLLNRERDGSNASQGTVKLRRFGQNTGARGLSSCRVGRAVPLRRRF